MNVVRNRLRLPAPSVATGLGPEPASCSVGITVWGSSVCVARGMGHCPTLPPNLSVEAESMSSQFQSQIHGQP